MSAPSRVSESHWAAVAAARFYLACVVMNAHCGLAIPLGPLPLGYLFGRYLGPLAAILGFLLISGFSIGNSYQRPHGFYRRRICRIYPSLLFAALLYATALVVLAPITTTSGDVFPAPRLSDILCTFLGLNGVLVGSFLSPTWSLSVEMIYYGVTPVLDRMRFPWLLLLCADSAALYWLNVNLGIGPLPTTLYGISAASLFWAWGSGFIFAKSPMTWAGFLVAGPGILLLKRFNYEGGALSGVTFLIAASAIVFGGRTRLPASVRAVFNYLGDLSYPLYLLHFPTIVLLNGLVGVRSLPVLMIASLAISVFCLHAIERPLRAVISRLFLRESRFAQTSTILVP